MPEYPAAGTLIDANAVHRTGDEIIGGIKSFNTAPQVPDDSWTESDTANLLADLAAKATDAVVVHKATASADIGAGGLTEANTAGLVADLAAKVTTATYFLADVMANRPAAGTPARLFAATDTGQWFRDDGATWHEVLMAEHAAVDDYEAWTDVRAHGGDPTFATECSAAFQAAYDRGGTTFAGPGTYKIGAALVAGRAAGNGPVHFKGSGRRTCTLRWTGGASTMITIDSFNGHDSVFENFNVQNTSAATVAIQVNGVRVTIRRVGYVNSAVRFSTAIISTFQAAGHTYATTVEGCYFSEGNTGAETPVAIDFAGGHTFVVDRTMVSGFPIGVQSRVGGSTSVLGLSVTNSRIECFQGVNPGYAGGATATGIVTSDTLGFNVTGTNFELNGDSGAAAAPGQRAIKLGANSKGGLIAGGRINGNSTTFGIEIADASAAGWVVRGVNFASVTWGVGAWGTGTLWSGEVGTCYMAGGSGLYDNTWTPTVTIGGSAVGITYSTQVGHWVRRGNRMRVELVAILSSKGANAGTVRITGLPVAAVNVVGLLWPGSILSLVFVSPPVLMPVVQANESQVRIFKNSSGSEITDVDLNNNTRFEMAIEYEIAG